MFNNFNGQVVVNNLLTKDVQVYNFDDTDTYTSYINDLHDNLVYLKCDFAIIDNGSTTSFIIFKN